MCGDSPPPTYKGPGDAHSNQEWIWQRRRYMDLFATAPADVLCGESTPFYLYNRDARRRIAADIPHARLIAVLRDPVDRLYSNWMHLWVDGLEPCADVVEAVSREQRRIDAGWAPFWHYRALGMYGRQVADLFSQFPRDQVLLLRYRDLVEQPDDALARVCRFLGVAERAVSTVPVDNARPFVHPGPRTRVLGPVIRGGAKTGACFRRRSGERLSRALVGAVAPSRAHRETQADVGTTGRLAGTVPRRHRPLGTGSRANPSMPGDSIETGTRSSPDEPRPRRRRRLTSGSDDGRSSPPRRPAGSSVPARSAGRQAREQVVRAVGARCLEVEAGRPVRQPDGGGIAQGAARVR